MASRALPLLHRPFHFALCRLLAIAWMPFVGGFAFELTGGVPSRIVSQRETLHEPGEQAFSTSSAPRHFASAPGHCSVAMDVARELTFTDFSDVHSEDLHGDISVKIGYQYLSDADGEVCQDQEMLGILWGHYNRPIVSAVVGVGNKRKHVHFVIHTGSPSTFVCEEALKALDCSVADPMDPLSVDINNVQISVLQSPADKQFSDINILGGDFLALCSSMVSVDYGAKKVKLIYS